MSIPDTLSIFLVPLIGSVVDKYGYKAKLITLGGFGLLFGHLLFICKINNVNFSPAIPLMFLGFGNSSMLAFWPCVPLLVSEAYIATAYGLLTVFSNFSFTLFPLIVAWLAGRDVKYGECEAFFAIIALFGTVLSGHLEQSSFTYGIDLNSPELDKSIEMKVKPSSETLKQPSLRAVVDDISPLISTEMV